MGKIKGMRSMLYIMFAFLPLCLSLQSCSPAAGGTGLGAASMATGGIGASNLSQTAANIVNTSLQLSASLTGFFSNNYDASKKNLDAHPALAKALNWWENNCIVDGSLCNEAQSGYLQCVEFVTGVFGQLGINLPYVNNAYQFWGGYANNQYPGWQELPNDGLSKDQPQPGDMVIWSGGKFGHIAIVVGVVPQIGSQPGVVTVADANASSNFHLTANQNFPWTQAFQNANLHQMSIINGRVIENAWPWLTVDGFIRPPQVQGGAVANGAAVQQPLSTNSLSPWEVNQIKNFTPEQQGWVSMAQQAAQNVAISPSYLVAQLLQESNFKNTGPNYAGALGVAQFTPGTALEIPSCVATSDRTQLQTCIEQPALKQCILDRADCIGLTGIVNGIDPSSPTQAIPAAAYLMSIRYDYYLKMALTPPSPQDKITAYERALAAYNAGRGAVDAIVNRCGPTWLTCLDDEQTYAEVRDASPVTHETLNYVNKIMAEGQVTA